MELLKKLDLDKVNKLIEEGYIYKVDCHINIDGRHLSLYNYTSKTQYENYWNDYTIQLRGLIADKKGNIIARPFPKIFNIEDNPELFKHLKHQAFEITEKMDGSLGIVYFINYKPYIATRGSFDSLQARKANEMLNTNYQWMEPQLLPQYTYLFEIIYPENRIVVNYKNTEELILLAVIETATGREIPLEEFSYLTTPAFFPHSGFQKVKKITDILSLEELRGMNEPNKEGYVIRFEDGTRVKFKFEDYKTIHALVTDITTLRLWKLAQHPFNERLMKIIPDELYKPIKCGIDCFKDKYYFREVYFKLIYENYARRIDYGTLDTRKKFADRVIEEYPQYASILFAIHDKKDYSKKIWELIKPVDDKTL